MKKLLIFALLFSATTLAESTKQHRFGFGGLPVEEEEEGCSNFQGMDSCRGQQTEYAPQEETRRWQTPPVGHPSHRERWGSLGKLQGYARIQYASDRRSAVVIVSTVRKNEESPVGLQFQFGINAAWTLSERFEVGNDFDDDAGLVVSVKSSGGDDDDEAVLVFDPLFFTWQNTAVTAPHTKNGQRGAIVELFGWPYADVALECETHLGKAGYMGVKIFPASEHVESFHYLQNGELNPWWFVYQPVSYRLSSRLGTRQELRDMIQRCRKSGVRVYADAVVNHMTGSGNDVLLHRNQQGGNCAKWGPKNATAGSPFFTHSWAYENNEFTGQRPGLEFPAVPYGPTDFHCERTLGDWSSGFSLNYGWLVGLTDLNTGKSSVRQRIADYMTDLLSIGFSGFRIDAAKHISPDDLAAIFALVHKNMGGSLPDDFISWLEVIIGGERDLLACQDGYYNYYGYFDGKLTSAMGAVDASKVKIWSSDYPKEHPICGRWVLPASRFVIQNDDHDQQNPGSSSRDMQDKGSVLIKERDVAKHRSFEKQLFERSDADWAIKVVLSSYTFMANGAQGYPDGKSDCKLYLGNEYTSPTEKCKSVPYTKAHDPNSCGYSVLGANKNWAEGKYTRVHRDLEIIRAMRKWSGLNANVQASDVGLPQSCQ